MCSLRTGSRTAPACGNLGIVRKVEPSGGADTGRADTGGTDTGGTDTGGPDTSGADYAERLRRLETVWWKRALDVQRPYRRNLARLRLGRTLDVGAGLGRNLAHLPVGSVGVDHNPDSVAIARGRGLDMLTSQEFDERAAGLGHFDSLLMSHVLEHMSTTEGDRLLDHYLPHIKPAGTVVLICPQERGYATDATHVRFVDPAVLREHAQRHRISQIESRSFPLPKIAGRVFAYNEFLFVGRLPG